MLLDIYVLASPSPTLYVYPSGTHRRRGTTGGLPTPVELPRVYKASGSLRVKATLTGKAVGLHGSGKVTAPLRPVIRLGLKDVHYLHPDLLLLEELGLFDD
jgi:hypothetical protein